VIDLHVHSTCSDGSLSPEELADRAAGLGLHGLALTDHDTIAGNRRLQAQAARRGIEGVSGVEISVDWPVGTMPLLGYFLDGDTGVLEDCLGRLREGRNERNVRILSALARLGLEVSAEEVRAEAGGEVVGRPHIARALVARGYVRGSEEAFDKYLGKGCPAYVYRYRLSPADGMKAIARAGGLAVLAHPFTVTENRREIRALVVRLAGEGLQGIECYYPEHTADQASFCANLARERGLAITGGSDFHGSLNPAIEMGRGFGSLKIADELLSDLRSRLARPAAGPDR